MADSLYRAKITHTEKTVEQLYKMQYNVYEKPRILLRLLIGFGLMAIYSLVHCIEDVRKMARPEGKEVQG